MASTRIRDEQLAMRGGAAIATAMAGGAGLAALAVAVDEMEFPGAGLLLVLVSTGLSWGAAAVAVGAFSRERTVACVAGLALLVTAVASYYGFHSVLGLRDTSARALLRAVQLWGLVALLGGPVLGFLGWTVRFGARRSSSIALGTLCGLLLGQGLVWALSYGLSPHPVFTVALVAPLVLLVVGLHGRAIAPAVFALVGSSTVSAAIWAVLERIG